MNNIGFFLTNIQQESHKNILEAIDNYAKSHPYDNVIVFNNTFETFNTNNSYYVVHLSHAKYFDGILFVFNSTDASVTSNFPGPKKQIFITDQIYWQIQKHIPYILWKNIFMNTNLEIVSQSPEHEQIYNMCWKKPLYVSKEFNTETIKNVTQKI